MFLSMNTLVSLQTCVMISRETDFLLRPCNFCYTPQPHPCNVTFVWIRIRFYYAFKKWFVSLHSSYTFQTCIVLLCISYRFQEWIVVLWMAIKVEFCMISVLSFVMAAKWMMEGTMRRQSPTYMVKTRV